MLTWKGLTAVKSGLEKDSVLVVVLLVAAAAAGLGAVCLEMYFDDAGEIWSSPCLFEDACIFLERDAAVKDRFLGILVPEGWYSGYNVSRWKLSTTRLQVCSRQYNEFLPSVVSCSSSWLPSCLLIAVAFKTRNDRVPSVFETHSGCALSEVWMPGSFREGMFALSVWWKDFLKSVRKVKGREREM